MEIHIFILAMNMRGGGNIMKEIFHLFIDSGLHDYLLKDIHINYSTSVIIIKLADCKNNSKDIILRHFKSFTLNNIREWGEGAYIVSSDVIANDTLTTLEFQLNSGDECCITLYNS